MVQAGLELVDILLGLWTSSLRLFLPVIGILTPGQEHEFPTYSSSSPSRLAALWYRPWKDAVGHVREHGVETGVQCARVGST